MAALYSANRLIGVGDFKYVVVSDPYP